MNRRKTEYMCVNERQVNGTVKMQGEEVAKVEDFKYLGSTVQSNGEYGSPHLVRSFMYEQKNARKRLALSMGSFSILTLY